MKVKGYISKKWEKEVEDHKQYQKDKKFVDEYLEK